MNVTVKIANTEVTPEDKAERAKLVRDEEGLAGRPDFSNKKENGMEDTYKVGNHNRTALIERGKHAYGSKVDNSVCECPECYGGGKLGLFACRNCRGTGKVENAEKLKCPNCGSTNIQKGEGYKLDKCLSCHTAFDNPEEDDSNENSKECPDCGEEMDNCGCGKKNAEEDLSKFTDKELNQYFSEASHDDDQLALKRARKEMQRRGI
jgi:DNA-directed RNA polymerase subunit RPC12/RpoP